MANVQVSGFQAAKRLGGGSISYSKGRVLTNNTTAIFLNDAVAITAAGDYIVAAVTTTAVANTANGAVYTDANGRKIGAKYLPATTLYTSSGVAPENMSEIYIVDDVVNTLFLCSVDAAIALTDLNLNYAMVLGAGSTTTGLSAHELNDSGRATTATLPWRVREFVIGPDTDPDAADAHVYAQINAGFTEPALSAYTGT